LILPPERAGARWVAGIHAEHVHDQIVQALRDSRRVRLDFANDDRSLGALVAWRGATVFRSIAFAHWSAQVEASIVKRLRQAGTLHGLPSFSERNAS
jgi:hypothetical protein